MNINLKEKPEATRDINTPVYDEDASGAFFKKSGFMVQIDKSIPEFGEFHFAPKGITDINEVSSKDNQKREYMTLVVKSLIEGWEEFISYRKNHPDSALANIYYLGGLTNNKFANFIVKHFGAKITSEYEDGRKKLFIDAEGVEEKLTIFKRKYKEFIEK
jgi:hypothetical protein